MHALCAVATRHLPAAKIQQVMAAVRPRDVVPLFGALVVGFVVFLLVNYLSLFGVVTIDSDLLTISLGVLVGFLVARLSDTA